MDKGSKLQEASEEQQFLRTVSDLDLWIDEVGKALALEDLGKVSKHYLIIVQISSSFRQCGQEFASI